MSTHDAPTLGLTDGAGGDEGVRAAARASFARGDTAQTLALVYPLFARYPADNELLTLYGLALSGSGRHADALSILGRIDLTRLPEQVGATIVAAMRVATAAQEASAPAQQAPPAQPPRTQGVRALALDLDEPSSDLSPTELRGELRAVMHRRVTSYARLWAGMAVLAFTPLYYLAVREQLDPNSSNYNPDQVTPIRVTIGGLVLLVIMFLLSAVIASRFAKCSVYERRIDVQKGVLSQSKDPVWLYDISGIDMRRPPLLTLTRTARIDLDTDRQNGKPKRHRIVATGNLKSMTSFMEKLQGDVILERRAMKKMWI